MKVLTNFTSPGKCSGQIIADDQNWILTVQGTCDSGETLKYLAAAPGDIRQSRAGSGLPFPSAKIAYEGTPNKGTALINNGKFQFQIVYPSAYYVDNGSKLLEPHIQFTIDDQEAFDVKVGPSRFCDRSLKHLQGRARRTTGR